MANLFDDMPEPAHHKIGPITRSEKLARDEWLGHHQKSYEDIFEKTRLIYNKNKTVLLQGQLIYYQAYIKALKHLRAVNWQAKEKGK